MNARGMEVSNESKEVDLKLAVFTALHCAVRTIDHLGEMLKILGKATRLENIRLHRTKCTALISAVIAPAYLTKLVKDIGDFKFALTADESTDISVTKFLALCVRYYSAKNRMLTDFLGILEVTSGTGAGLADNVKQYLKTIHLSIKQMKSVSVDGANAVSGLHNSFYTHLKEEVPDLQLIKCICHSIPKCAEYA